MSWNVSIYRDDSSSCSQYQLPIDWSQQKYRDSRRLPPPLARHELISEIFAEIAKALHIDRHEIFRVSVLVNGEFKLIHFVFFKDCARATKLRVQLSEKMNLLPA